MMKPQNDTPELNQQPEAVQAKGAPQLSRRKFIMTAGVSSLPVMMSLKSGDAWGCVGLQCSPGTGNYSGTRSAVLSAQKTKGSAYVTPVWDTISNIKKVVEVDFGRKVTTQNYGFLLMHYDFASFIDSNGAVTLLKKRFANPETWLTEAQRLQSKNQLYMPHSSGYVSFNDWVYPPNGRKYPLIRPASYDGKILVGSTNLSTFFPSTPRMNTTVSNALNSTDSFVKYLAAAFIGSVWESHPIWNTTIPGSVKKTNCYPKPHELITAYNNVVTRRAKTIGGVEAGLNDMGELFKMYTKAG